MSEHRHIELALEQARFEATPARRQYEAVNPDHRLVAAELERRWNEALAAVARLEEVLATRGMSDASPMTPSAARATARLGNRHGARLGASSR